MKLDHVALIVSDMARSLDFYTRFLGLTVKRGFDLSEAESRDLKTPETLGQKVMITGCILFIVFFCGLPMASLVFKSLWLNGGPTLIFYRQIFLNVTDSIFYVSPGTAMSNSLVFALATLGLALVVGMSAAGLIRSSGRRGGAFLEPLFMLPLSTSAVTLGFGIIITLDKPPLNLRTSPFLVPAAHTLVAFPFVVRTVLPAIKAIPPSLKEAAAVLGASRYRSWMLVDLPIIARAVAAGAIFAFTMSLGEFGATLFVSRPEFSTMPMAIYRFLGRPGIMNHGQAMAVSSLLMAVTAAGFMMIEIALFQKLTLYIGQPVFTLTVLLTSLLLGTGIGSLTSSLIKNRLATALSVAALLTAVAEARGMPESLLERSAAARAKKTDGTVDDVLTEWAEEAGLVSASPQAPAASPTPATVAAGLTGAALLTRGVTEATRQRSLLSGNLCRCTGYIDIVDAILDASENQERKETK